MSHSGHLWAIILAAGDGKRLSALTRDGRGLTVPKQYCSFDGCETMLRWAVKRAGGVVPLDSIVPVVAAQHRRWWQGELADLPAENIVVQPANKGTAAGLLLPLTEILERDRLATVVVLPADHHVDDEDTLRRTIFKAIRVVDTNEDAVVLLGIVPERSDADYGWILPAGVPGSCRRVATFVEKPAPESAARLMGRGGLLNSMIVVAGGATLLGLYARSVPRLLERFVEWRDPAASARRGLESLYETLPSCDFSREVLERRCGELRVLEVPGCGWTDLGTPARLDLFRQQRHSETRGPLLDVG